MTLATSDPTIFGLIAAFCSLAGVFLAAAGHRMGRKAAERKAEQETHEQLLAARKEAEELSAELHKLRMEQNDPPGQG
jgi:uncharacterized protein YlxW (UPF0749 family)